MSSSDSALCIAQVRIWESLTKPSALQPNQLVRSVSGCVFTAAAVVLAVSLQNLVVRILPAFVCSTCLL